MTEVLLGQTDYSKFVFIPDPASTDGSGKTGLVAANLTVSYCRMETDNDATVTDVTSSLNDLAALTTAHTDWGIKEISNTLAPGLYRIDFADAVFASGAWTAVVYVMITTSAAAASPIEFELVAVNKLDAVRMGMTALPNAAADAAGGLIISDAGGLDADDLKADVTAILVDTGTTLDGRIPAALVSGRMDASVGAMAANVMTAAAAAADLTTELQNGLATAAALATVDGIVDDILLDTAEIGAAGAGLTAINLPNQTMDIVGSITGNLSGSVGSVTGAVASVTGAVGSVTGNVGGTINGLTATALKDFFDTDSTTTYASAVAGSVVAEIADNAGGASLTVSDIADEVQTRTIAAVTVVNGLAANSVNASALAADAVTEIQTGLSSQASVDDLPTNAELATALGTADDAVLTAVAGVQSDTNDIQARLPAALVSGRMDSSTGAMAANVMTSAAAAASLTTELQTGLATQASVDTIDDFLDTEVAAIKAKTDLIPGTIDGKTYAQLVTLISAVLLGKVSGAGTGTEVYRAVDDTKDRVTATIDASFNRTAITLDAA